VGLGAELIPGGEAPYLALPATWADYLRGQPQTDRYRINRALRDLEAWSGGDWQLERPRTPDELARARDALIDLHRRRWEGQGGGAFRSPHFLAFHDRLMPELFAQGALELLLLRVRSEPVAALYNFVWDDKVSFYQCGRRLDVPKGARPGVALMALAIRSAIEAGRREFDFLEGTSRFKMQFTKTTRPLVRVRAYRPSLLERARRLAEAGRGVARRLRRGARALAARLGRAKNGPEGLSNQGSGPLFHATHE
jgi:CelD/BcsL family acetyltransferase involved in cellulose biosynthesis